MHEITHLMVDTDEVIDRGDHGSRYREYKARVEWKCGVTFLSRDPFLPGFIESSAS